MLKFRRKLLAAVLAATIALSSGVVWSEEADDADGVEAVEEGDTAGEGESGDTGDDETVSDEADGEGENSEEGDADEAGDEGDEDAAGEEGESGESAEEGADDTVDPVTQDEALAAMKVYAENDNLKLYVNEETCIFAVENKKSGYIWWSAPYDYESDPIAANLQKQMMASLLSYKQLDVVNGTLSNTTTYSYESSVSQGAYECEQIDNGVKFTFEFPWHNMLVPLTITLEENSFTAAVPTDEINEKVYDDDDGFEYKLITMNLLQSLGAGRADEEGYLLLPDGSGAAIKFNNGKTSTTVYQAKVYGDDLAVSKTTAGVKSEQVYLPVIGIVKNLEAGDEALLAVVTGGDAYASVNASVNGQATTSINSAWFSFDFRATDTYTMGTKTPLTVFQSGDVRVDELSVRYYVMSGDEVNVADLANTYRNYLIDEKGLTQKTSANSADLYVTTMGGTIKKQSVLGFPVDMQTVATSYEEALEIVQKLNGLGVDELVLTYNDFNDSGVTGKISSGVNYSKKLGGENAFDSLYGYIKDNGYTLYPSIDIMEYVRSGYGYSFTLNSSKRMTNAYATQTAFELAYGTPDTEVKPTWTILSPHYWPDLFRKVTESFKAEGIDTISLSQATSVLYSDFGRKYEGKEHYVRGDAMNILMDGYKQLNDAGISIIAQECNAYALPYVSSITNVPMYSSNYDLFDYDVPFYELVVQGYIPYSSKPVNASSNAEELKLLSLLTGANPHYELMYHSPNDFTDSEYDVYFYANYEGWLEKATADYKLFSENTSSLSDKTITKYERETDRIFTATYSDGTVITVDTGALTFTVNGKEGSLADYELKGEEN